MTQEQETRMPWEIVIIASVLMILVIWVGVNLTLLITDSHPNTPQVHKAVKASMALKDTVKVVKVPATYMTAGVPVGANTRTLKKYYSRRAYSGAPPRIPHAIREVSGKMENCLSCHKSGGYVPSYKAYAPVTPHPQYTNCVQCHVPTKTKTRFKASLWVSAKPPGLGRSALPGGPPPVPHSLQYRSNCAACHSGPGAVREIRTPHPQRVNCLQCHVPSRTRSTFTSKFAVKK